MTKPIMPRHRRKAPAYIHPTRVQSGKPTRFGVERPFHAPSKSLGTLDIHFSAKGVTMPRYHEKARTPSEIEKDKTIHLPNQLAALRYTGNVRTSIDREAHNIDEISRQLAATHLEIEQNWKKYIPEARKSVSGYLVAIQGAIGNPKQLDSFYKKRAHENLGEVVRLLDAKHEGAALLKLGKVVDDLIKRKNQLTRQRVFLARRHNELLKGVAIRRRRLEEYLHDTIRRLDELRMLDVPKPTLHKMVLELAEEEKSMKRKVEPEVKQAAAHVQAAKIALSRGKTTEAIEELRKANRMVLMAHSRQYLMTESLLDFTAKSSNPQLRKTVYRQQLQILMDNTIFWFDRARNRENMVHHLEQFAHATKNDLGSAVEQQVRLAAAAVRNGQPSLAEEKLNEALQLAA